MSGYVGDLTDAQERTLKKFREAMRDVLREEHADQDLLRWLRARDFDLEKAETMYREALAWRRDFGADAIMSSDPRVGVLRRYMPGGFLPGTDRHGCPVYINPYGRIDMKGILRSCKKSDVLRHFVYIMETVLVRCKDRPGEEGRNGGFASVFYIFDLAGFSMRLFERATVDVFLDMSRIAESRYPEILRKIFVINAPKVMPIAWKIVSPVLHEGTRKKTLIFSGNYKEELLKEVAPDKLPICYGGTLTDKSGDPACGAWICYGGPVPEHYYFKSRGSVREGMTPLTVGRGSTVQLEYKVKRATSVIRYEFSSDEYDIGFGVFKRTSILRQKAGEMETIRNSERVNSHLVPEDGFVECQTPGTYIIRFDNTHSWTRSKTIHYNIEILEPNPDQPFGYIAEDETDLPF